MEILFADAVDERRVAALEEAGHQCRLEPGLGPDDLPGAIGTAEILVVRSTRVTAASVAAADRLALVIRAGAGTDTIDLAAASDAGIYVCNVPGRNAVAVAELTMGLLLAVDRRLADGTADLRTGRWDKATYTKADGLAGKTMSIIGLGDIGLAVAARAKAFDLTVQALRRPRSDDAAARIRSVGVRLVDDLDTLLGTADIVSIHVPKAPDTVGMVDDDFLAELPAGAILLNTSRGDVVDEAALLRALDGGLRAGLDVYRDEPSSSSGEFHSAVAVHPNVVGSHHIGASTTQAQEAVADGVIEVIEAFAAGDVVNCVNLETGLIGEAALVVRHQDEVGVLAKVLRVLSEGGRNVETMENRQFAGGGAAVATIAIDRAPDDDLLERLRAIPEVIAVEPTTRGDADRDGAR